MPVSNNGRWVVGHCPWDVQEYGAHGWWPEENESGRHNSTHYEFESSVEYAYQGEALWLVDVEGEDRRFNGGWNVGGVGVWNGRRNGRLFGGRYVGRDGRRSGRLGLVGGRVGGWNGTSRSSRHRMPPEIFFHWDKCCQHYDVPDFDEGMNSPAHDVHHDHHGYIINSSRDGVGFCGGPIDRGETGHRRRAAPSSRRQRPRLVHGTEVYRLVH